MKGEKSWVGIKYKNATGLTTTVYRGLPNLKIAIYLKIFYQFANYDLAVLNPFIPNGITELLAFQST